MTRPCAGDVNRNGDATTRPVERASPQGLTESTLLTITGGDVNGCLTDKDLDAFARPLLGGRYIVAKMFYAIRRGEMDVAQAREMLVSKAKTFEFLLVPVHVRHHWATAIVEFNKTQNALTALIYDSAPSAITTKDFIKLFKKLEIRWMVAPWYRQPRNSNQCGLHVLLLALLHSISGRRIKTGDPTQFVDLNETRRALACGNWKIARNLFVKALPLLVKPPPSYDEAVIETAKHDKVKGASPLDDDCTAGGATVADSSEMPQQASNTVRITGGAPLDNPNNVCWANALAQCLIRALDSCDVMSLRNDILKAAGAAMNSGGHEDLSEGMLKYLDTNTALSEVLNSEVTTELHCGRCGSKKLNVGRDVIIWGLSNGTESLPVEEGMIHDGRCERCRMIGLQTRTHVSKGAERMMILAARRFSPLAVETRVDFPDQFTLGGRTYNLSSVAGYTGTGVSGHYVALIKDGETFKRWSDEHLSVLTAARFHEEARKGYLFFYVQEQHDQTDAAPHGDTHAAPDTRNETQRTRPSPNGCRLGDCVAHERTTNGPGKGTKKPKTVTHGEVRRRLHVIKYFVDVTWSSDQEGGRWCGRVSRKSLAGRSASVTYDGSWCSACGQWHEIEPLELDLPLKGIVYYEVTELDDPPVRTTPCQRSDSDSDDDQVGIPANSRPDTKEDQEILGQAERTPLSTLPHGAWTDMKGDIGRQWFVHSGRPPHVHEITWRQMAQSTRRSHAVWLQRIRAMPSDLATRPLPQAIVELVLRFRQERNWKWPTVSAAFSAIATALKQLPLYTNVPHGIQITDSPVYLASMRHAQHLAKVTATTGEKSAAMTFEQFNSLLSDLKIPSAWMFAQMCWRFASRAGDMRQILGDDVTIEGPDRNGRVPVAVLFRRGKGAAFWGPYSVHSIFPANVAQRLAAHLRDSPILFAKSDQQQTANAIKRMGKNLSLRSMRKGALTHAAMNGVSESSIQLLSGHKRRDTLLRYLGWGKHSPAAKNAAQEVADKTLCGGGTDIEEIMRPPKMGLRSGFCGRQGRRVEPPPSLFPPKAPTNFQLGIPEEEERSESWPLHAKKVGLVNWHEVLSMAKGTPLAEKVRDARVWSTTSKWYGVQWGPLFPSQVPTAKFTKAQIETLVDTGKIKELGNRPIRAYVKGFTHPEPDKKRYRPIFEPIINATCARDELVDVHYPSRRERRSEVGRSRFRAQFDAVAFYDQLPLAEDVQSYFVMRTSEPIHGCSLFVVTREPMGARFSAGSAQVVTWVAAFPLMQRSGVQVVTMIDNTFIGATTETDFVWAIRTFIRRTTQMGITIKEIEDWSKLNDQEMVQRGSKTFLGRDPYSFIFLGEQFVQNTVANTAKNLGKLKRAFERIQRHAQGLHAEKVSRRHFAAFVGLVHYLWNTLDARPELYLSMRRAHSKICSEAVSDKAWDEPVILAPTVLADLTEITGILLANEPVRIRSACQPSLDNEAYDTIIIVDASASGWGAYAKIGEETFEVRRAWTEHKRMSAHAEPIAATEAIRWARTHGAQGNVAVVTDHEAMAKGQRRWWSGHGGFSSAYPINEFFVELYNTHPDAQVFFVDGARNIADGPSRGNQLGHGLRWGTLRGSFQFPDLKSFVHPYFKRSPKEDWER